jgi:hypothetical protein
MPGAVYDQTILQLFWLTELPRQISADCPALGNYLAVDIENWQFSKWRDLKNDTFVA